jgi:two-component system, NarL family, sensor kinase
MPAHCRKLVSARDTQGCLYQHRSTPTSYTGLVLNSLGVGYFRVDRNYNITDANKPALDWLSKSREAVIGQPFSVVVPQSPMKLLKAAVEQKIFADRQLQSYQRPDRSLDLHVYPAGDGAIVFFQDRTEHDLQRQEAVRAQVLLQSSLDASSAQVVVLDDEGTIIKSNAVWQKFAIAQGLIAPELNYLQLYRRPFARREDALRIGATLTSLLKGECRTVSLLHAWPIMGKVRWFQLNAARFECWGKTYVVVANEDVTAVKDARRASEEMAERLRTLQEEERQRIAKELHDSTAQHLVAVGLNVMRLKSKLKRRRQHAALFKEIEASVQEASKELRTFTYLLHPPKLDADGFRDTAERYALGFGRRAGLSVSIRIASISDEAPFEVQRCLFRIIQETLTNIYRHALASKVRIELRHLHRQLHLIVRDNGVGIELPESTDRRAVRLSTGVGIPGMQERLRHLGGELVIRSGPGGTRVHAIVPLDVAFRKGNGPRLGTQLRVRLSTVNGKPRGILPHQA